MDAKQLPHQHTDEGNMNRILEQLSKPDDFLVISDIFKQLGDATRLRILWLLCHCEECVTDIASILEMSSPAVSHHLRILKNCGLITSTRVGKEIYYKAANISQVRLMHQMIEQVMEIACPHIPNKIK